MIVSILITAVVSTAMLVAVFLATRNSRGVGTTVAAAALLFAIGFITFARIWLLQGLTTYAVAVVAAICGGRARAMRRVAVSCAVLSYGFVYLLVLADHSVNDQLRVKFPAQSVVERLAYENRVASSTTDISKPITLDKKIGERLQELERDRHAPLRKWKLQEVHKQSTADFEQAVGFGWPRMSYLLPSRLELP